MALIEDCRLNIEDLRSAFLRALGISNWKLYEPEAELKALRL
jgi:hypothetical protein